MPQGSVRHALEVATDQLHHNATIREAQNGGKSVVASNLSAGHVLRGPTSVESPLH